MPALFLSPRPRSIEKRGAPPLPNKLLNAVIITMIGKHNPTAPKAAVPIFVFLQYRFDLQYYKEDLKSGRSTSAVLPVRY